MSISLSKPADTREQLNSYIRHLQRRLRLRAALRGAAILTSAALATTVFLVLIINRFAFSTGSVISARTLLLLVLAAAVALGLVLPLRRLNFRRAARTAESAFPQFQQRLVTFAERDQWPREPFLELLAADTLEIARHAEPASLVPDKKLLVSLGAGLGSFAVLIWIILAGPGFLGYGASLLWVGSRPGVAPMYDIRVNPGDASVRRNSDELVTALPIGVQTDKVRLYARYQSASKWEEVTMQPQAGGSGFQFLFAGLPENVEYYVVAGAVHSRHFNLRVVDLPAVKQIRVTYRYPNWTGLQNVVDQHGGDLRAVEGTDADLEIQMDRPLRNGILALDNDRQIRLSGGQGNLYKGTIHMDKDGTYHVAALDQGQPVRLSEDFFIEAGKANPPEVAIDRPARDYRASPIEEVTVAAKAADDFGLNEFNLHYSVNGGPDKTVSLLKQKGAKSADGSTVLYLENFKLVPGDLVSIYATAKDAKTESRTDMFFIQADPFEREFSQSQQMAGGGGGGGGGGMGGQADIAEREKEIIASTWKQQGDKTASEKQSADTAKFLSSVQSTLRDQALSLAGRLQSRELSEQNDEFSAFQQDMTAAAEAMAPAAQKLKQQQWQDSIPAEQKALQHLLRAEATFRQIEVAFGQAGGGGGGGGSAGRDLASLFDLELDTEKNQYETAQTAASSSDQRAKDIDDALQKLDELARRQQDLAQQRNNSAQNLQERWQQEMLRRDAEQLQRQLEQLAQNNQNGQGNPQGSSSSGSSGQSASGQAGQSGQSSGQAGQSQGASDPRVQQALDRLKQANDDMRRADSGQQGNAEARRAADRLREATNMLAGAQQQHASGRLDAMGQEADRLAGEERDQADRLHKLFGNQQGSDQGAQNSPYGSLGGRFGSYGRSQMGSEAQEQGAQKLADDRQHLADDLAHLEKQMRDASRDLASNQISAATKLRNALGDLDSSDLETRIQRSADWLRRGIDPNSTSTEQEIGSGLQKLSDAVRQAQQSLGSEQPQDSQTALDRVERLRNQLEAMEPNGRRGQGGAQRGQAGQSGQPGQFGQNGGPISRSGQTGADGNFGDVNGGGDRGGRDYGGFDTGNNSNLPQPVGPNSAPIPGDTERNIQQGVNELNQLRGTLQNDPEAQREIDALIQKMQQLDPRRFPGNPAVVEQLHTQVLNDVDKLELQLQRKQDDKSGDIRSTDSGPMPAGYQDAVADYFRRLSNTH